jgi:hypothetical protein
VLTSTFRAAALILVFSLAASAQTGGSKTTSGITTDINTNQASGQGAAGTATKLRQTMLDMLVSTPNVYTATGFTGVDCTGATDSAGALQTAIAAIPDSSTLFFPTDCTLHIGSTVTVTDRVGLVLTSGIRQQDSGGAPQFVWVGANNGVMFDFEHCDHPTIRGFRFVTDGVHSVNAFLKFDGTTGGSHVGTQAEVGWNDFIHSSLSNASFVAVDWSRTATTNHENYYIHDNTITCDSGQLSTNRAIDGVVTSGSTTLTSATAAFVSGDAGKRIRLSFPGSQGGLFWDTTIASFTNSTTVVLAAAPSWIVGYIGASPLSNVQITTGTNFGVGLRQGASQNAKHTRIYYNQITGCDIQVAILGGSADIRHLGGGFGGTGVLAQGNLTDSIIIEQIENEGNLRELDLKGGVAPFTVIGSRVANINQLADGFYKLGSSVTLIGSGSVSSVSTGLGQGTTYATGNTHAILVGEQGNATTGATGSPVTMMSMNNQFGISLVLSGYGLFFYGFMSFNDQIGTNPNATTVLSGGQQAAGSVSQVLMPNLPTSAPGGCTGTGRLWNNSGVLTVC